jgi:hypothetical protein
MMAEFKKWNNSIKKWFLKHFSLCMVFFFRKRLGFLFQLFLLKFSLGKLIKLLKKIKKKLLKN